MKPRHNRLLLLPVGAGVILGAALVWSWGTARLVPGRAMEIPAANRSATMPDERDLRGDAKSATRFRAPWSHDRTWTGAGPGRAGLFDQRVADRVPGPEVPRLRRREVVLVATRDLPFRLQLIGHFGEGGNLSGIFEAEGAGSPLLARAGDDLAEFGLTVRALELEPAEGGGPPRVVARIRDRRAEREMVLPESVRVPSGTGAALLAPAGYPGEAIELLAGEVVEVGDSEFLVERIGLAPASATLRRLAVVIPDTGDDELFLQVEEDPES